MRFILLFLLWCCFSFSYNAGAATPNVNKFFADKIAQCEGKGIEKVKDVFCFNGSIPDDVEKKKYWDDFRSSKIIILNSPGGEVESAMKMARYMNGADVTTILHGVCSSSCVNYLLPVSRNLFLDRNTTIFGLHWPVTPKFFESDFREICKFRVRKYPEYARTLNECLDGKRHQEEMHLAFFEEFPTATLLWKEFYKLVRESTFPKLASCKGKQVNCTYHLHVDKDRLKAMNPEAMYFNLGSKPLMKRCLDRGVFYKNVGKDCHHPITP